MWVQEANFGIIGHPGLPTRVGFCGDLVKPSLDAGALISPMVPCIRVWLADMFATCCSPRGWSGDGAENSKKRKIWQPGTHRKLHNSGYAGRANTTLWGNRPLVTCFKIHHLLLAKSLAPWRDGMPDLA